MKIQPHKFLGLMFDADIQTKIFVMQQKEIAKHPVVSERKRFEGEVHDLLITEGNRNYLMSKPSLEISSKIKIDENKFDGTIFSGLRVGKKITILINDRLFYRYMVAKDCILCLWVTTEPTMIDGVEQNYLKYTTFRINTEDGYLSYPQESKPFQVEIFKKFIQHLIFLEFSELETVTLRPNVKVGTRKQGQYLNESKSDVVIIDSNWNRIVIKHGEFEVSGHLRLRKKPKRKINLHQTIYKGWIYPKG